MATFYLSIISSLLFCREFGLCWKSVDENSTDDSTALEFVHILYRNGDRSPVGSMLSGWKEKDQSDWDIGYNQLTMIGVQQQIKLGRFLKNRYWNYFSTTHKKDDIYVRSTDKDVTKSSASANLIVLNPIVIQSNRTYSDDDDEDPIVAPRSDNDDIGDWRPIPVNTVPYDVDTLLAMDIPCPTVQSTYRYTVWNSDEFLKVERENADFFRFLEFKTNVRPLRLHMIGQIFDSLHCHIIHDRREDWPDWVNSTVFNKIKELYRISTTFLFNTPEIQRLRGGLLFDQIAKRMINISKEVKCDGCPTKAYVYSSDDLTQIALLENLGLYDGSAPTYAQALMIELHSTPMNNKVTYFVKIFKRNETDNAVLELKMPNCDSLCSLSQFATLAKQRAPDDWTRECGLAGTDDDTFLVIGILIAVIVMCTVSIVGAFLCHWSAKSSRNRQENKPPTGQPDSTKETNVQIIVTSLPL